MTTTLLGVDDSKTMRKVLEITFAGEDFRTVLAENADDAMSKLHAERPSVVLVDAALDGGGGGYDLCQRLKAAAPGVGVVLLSSKQQPYDRNRATQAGADDFIDKPFDTQQLIDKVVGVLRKSATAQVAPRVPASAPQAAPAPLSASRPQPVEAVSPRPRTATLAYGSHFTPQGGSSPVAPVVPPTAPRPGIAPSAPHASARAVTPPPPAVMPAPPPVAPAPIAYAAPTPVAPPAPPAPVAAAVANHTANGSDLSHKLAGLGLTADQVAGVLALSRDVVEKVVWEVVPTLAETIIKEEIRRLTSE